MAKSQFTYADTSLIIRLLNMYKDSLISAQQMDEMTFKRNAAEEQMNAAESMYLMAQKGARARRQTGGKRTVRCGSRPS